MLSSDAMRKWAAEFAAAAQAESAPRNSSRIISAERLAAYVPFAMAEFGRESRESFAERRGASGGTFSDAPGQGAPRHGAPRPGVCSDGATAGSASGARTPPPFQQFGDELEPDLADRSGFDAGYAAGLEAGFADGRQRGFEAAIASAEEGRRQAEEQVAAVLPGRIDALVDALAVRFEQIEREAADDVVALALDVARQVLRSTLVVHPEAILPVVQEALAGLFEDRARMRLHLHPSDAELVRTALSARLDMLTCEIVADPFVDAGGCRVVTPRAEIDATLATRWQRTLASIGRNGDGSLADPGEIAQ